MIFLESNDPCGLYRSPRGGFSVEAGVRKLDPFLLTSEKSALLSLISSAPSASSSSRSSMIGPLHQSTLYNSACSYLQTPNDIRCDLQLQHHNYNNLMTSCNRSLNKSASKSKGKSIYGNINHAASTLIRIREEEPTERTLLKDITYGRLNTKIHDKSTSGLKLKKNVNIDAVLKGFMRDRSGLQSRVSHSKSKSQLHVETDRKNKCSGSILASHRKAEQERLEHTYLQQQKAKRLKTCADDKEQVRSTNCVRIPVYEWNALVQQYKSLKEATETLSGELNLYRDAKPEHNCLAMKAMGHLR